jgi:CubicO group peptidase (beta-lactamase class C family)
MQVDPMQDAIQFAVDHESTWDRDPAGVWGVHPQDPPPWNRLLGPVHPRGPVSGTIVVKGEMLASWGEPRRADLTFSVAKTYLALLAGLAHDRGLLPDVNERIGARLKGIGFDDPHNAKVTWAQMLQQTSEWTGEVFGLPDQVDHYRAVTFAAAPDGKKGDPRPLQKPGSYWEYNDVRINQLSLALLHLFQRPLPQVFREEIMRPIGASEDWNWVGYDNAFPVARIGAAASRFRARTRPLSGNCCWMKAWRATASACCRPTGSAACGHRGHWRRSTVIWCG